MKRSISIIAALSLSACAAATGPASEAAAPNVLATDYQDGDAMQNAGSPEMIKPKKETMNSLSLIHI